MENTRINLHLNRKKVFIFVLLIAVLLIGLNVVTVLAVEDYFSQLESLVNSDYLYSATMGPSLDKDDYLCFDAGISFKTSKDSNTSLNANILMQADGSQYSDKVYWNSQNLSSNGIAISSNLANKYGIEIGDTLFSKHVVTDEVYEYHVEYLLPKVSYVRMNDEDYYGRGIIIMGYDEKYANNLSHVNLVFSQDSIDDLYSRSQGTLSNIIYRDDEIVTVAIQLIPYVIVFSFISALLAIMSVFYFKKELAYNIKRQITIGFDAKKINVAYFQNVFGINVLMLLMVFGLSVLAVVLAGITTIMILYYLFVFLLGTVLLIIFTRITLKSLWRK